MGWINGGLSEAGEPVQIAGAGEKELGSFLGNNSS